MVTFFTIKKERSEREIRASIRRAYDPKPIFAAEFPSDLDAHRPIRPLAVRITDPNDDDRVTL